VCPILQNFEVKIMVLLYGLVCLFLVPLQVRMNGGVLCGLMHLTWAGWETYYLQDHSVKFMTVMQIHMKTWKCARYSPFCCPFQNFGSTRFQAAPNSTWSQWPVPGMLHNMKVGSSQNKPWLHLSWFLLQNYAQHFSFAFYIL
jgi:hypothetical protein